MHCSLGSSSCSNVVYSEYRVLTGTMNFSKTCAHWYFITGYLEDNSTAGSLSSWIDDTLITASNWLKRFLKFILTYLVPTWKIHFLVLLTCSTMKLHHRIYKMTLCPNVNFNVEVHNEDYHYSHLMAGLNRRYLLFTKNSCMSIPWFLCMGCHPYLSPLLWQKPTGRTYAIFSEWLITVITIQRTGLSTARYISSIVCNN